MNIHSVGASLYNRYESFSEEPIASKAAVGSGLAALPAQLQNAGDACQNVGPKDPRGYSDGGTSGGGSSPIYQGNTGDCVEAVQDGVEGLAELIGEHDGPAAQGVFGEFGRGLGDFVGNGVCNIGISDTDAGADATVPIPDGGDGAAPAAQGTSTGSGDEVSGTTEDNGASCSETQNTCNGTSQDPTVSGNQVSSGGSTSNASSPGGTSSGNSTGGTDSTGGSDPTGSADGVGSSDGVSSSDGSGGVCGGNGDGDMVDPDGVAGDSDGGVSRGPIGGNAPGSPGASAVGAVGVSFFGGVQIGSAGLFNGAEDVGGGCPISFQG